jgi:hypothetical protein
MFPVDVSAFRGLPLLCAVLAGCCMLLALRFAKEAFAPLGVLVRAAAAIAGVGLAVGAAVVLAAAAVFAR